MKVYHGSIDRIEKPIFGKWKPYNDYGLGFYCTRELEIAKEWSCGEDHDGYANEYDIQMDNLKVLNLNAPEYIVVSHSRNWQSALT